jgi:hypothetical protein
VCLLDLEFFFLFLVFWEDGKVGWVSIKFEEAKFSSTLFLSFDFDLFFWLSFSEMEGGKFSVGGKQSIIVC